MFVGFHVPNQNHFNPFQPSVAFHIETSHLICIANQMTGSYMECNTGLEWVSVHFFEIIVDTLRVCWTNFLKHLLQINVKIFLFMIFTFLIILITLMEILRYF